MPKPISRNLYRCIEWHLHNRRRLIHELRDATEDIFWGSASRDQNTPRGHGAHADQTATKGCLLASADIAKREQWLAVIEQTYEYFTGAQERRMAELFYGRHTSVQAVASKMTLTTRTVGKLRDNFVYRCAMSAAVAGVVELDEREEA